ncbi:MAG: hypothetical protein D6820_00540 [Lentisphaerae bacterium]|nr:MAG: hypothetical protein D6820_00540 [Lentisphaerota bacterium]
MVLIMKEIRELNRNPHHDRYSASYSVRIVDGVSIPASDSLWELDNELSEKRLKKVFTIMESCDYFSARHIAEFIAEFYGYCLGDKSTGGLNLRKPDELDLAYHEGLRKRGEKVELPPQPKPMQSRMQGTVHGVEIEVPSGISPLYLLLSHSIIWILGGILMMVIITCFVTACSNAPSAFNVATGALMAMSTAILRPLSFLRCRTD